MLRGRHRLDLSFGAALLASTLCGVGSSFAAEPNVAPAPRATSLSADLNGTAIDVARVGLYYCHDFAYPRIHCFSTAGRLEAAVQPVLSASSINYVAVFDYTSYQGPYMYISQNYSVLYRLERSNQFLHWAQ
jgi:hypothetical protein